MLVQFLGLLRQALKKTGLLPLIKRVLYRPSGQHKGPSPARGFVYRLKLLVEQANFASVEQVHDLPPIHTYWADKYLTPLFQSLGFASIEEFLLRELSQALLAANSSQRHILSIGSGNCDFEVEIALRLKAAGILDFRIFCMDINATMLQRGLVLARARAVQEHIAPLQADFNNWTPGNSRYCAVIANQSLHHVVNLEGLFDSVKTALAPGGVFLVSDMIGRNGHMRWPEALELVNAFWKRLPPSYRHNRYLGRIDEEFVNVDCSKAGFEGIRAQDILPLLVQRFHFSTFVPFGNIVDVFIDRAVGPNFDPGRDWDRVFIDEVQAADTQAIQDGRIKPTHLLAALRAEPVAMTLHPGNLSPQFCVRAS